MRFFQPPLPFLCLLLLAALGCRSTAERWSRFEAAATAAHEKRNYSEAAKQWSAAVQQAEKFGPEDPRLAESLENLGVRYRDLHKYAESEPLLQRALAIREKAAGENDPQVFSTMINLAELYKAEGKYAQAEPLYQQTLAITEHTSGPDSAAAATAVTSLAELYRAEGKFADAEPLYQRAL